MWIYEDKRRSGIRHGIGIGIYFLGSLVSFAIYAVRLSLTPCLPQFRFIIAKKRCSFVSFLFPSYFSYFSLFQSCLHVFLSSSIRFFFVGFDAHFSFTCWSLGISLCLFYSRFLSSSSLITSPFSRLHFSSNCVRFCQLIVSFL